MAVDVIMAKEVFPRSDSISAKVVAPSDFESMFSFIEDYVVSGFTVTAATGLDIDISTGSARLKGLYINHTATTTYTLTNNNTNYLYIQYTRDGNSEVESWTFVHNITGTPPSDSLQIATVVCSGGSVSTISQKNMTDTTTYAVLPTGSVQMYAGEYTKIPNYWLLCDGSAVSRTTYANLFATIGTQFGAGDGSTTFNLPDLQAKFPRGSVASTNPGSTGGADSVTLTASESGVGSHNHGVTDPGHSHGLGNGLPQPAVFGSTARNVGDTGTTFAQVVKANTTGISINNASAGASAAHENRPAFVELLFIIKV